MGLLLLLRNLLKKSKARVPKCHKTMGARGFLAGHKAGKGALYGPYVLDHVQMPMKLVAKGDFWSVASIIRFKTSGTRL